MTILIWILLISGLIILITVGLPILIYLCIKWGAVGFYRGKEAFRHRLDKVDVTTTNDKKRKYKNFNQE